MFCLHSCCFSLKSCHCCSFGVHQISVVPFLLFKNLTTSKIDNANNGENVVNEVDHVLMDFEPKVMNLTLGDEDRSHLELEALRRCKVSSSHDSSMFLDSVLVSGGLVSSYSI
ncbi:hypothetical protein P8452_60023 [Trifolium repens]|nr:hypothetical protein P8452_60023 [Trifolium repens]